MTYSSFIPSCQGFLPTLCDNQRTFCWAPQQAPRTRTSRARKRTRRCAELTGRPPFQRAVHCGTPPRALHHRPHFAASSASAPLCRASRRGGWGRNKGSERLRRHCYPACLPRASPLVVAWETPFPQSRHQHDQQDPV